MNKYEQIPQQYHRLFLKLKSQDPLLEQSLKSWTIGRESTLALVGLFVNDLYVMIVGESMCVLALDKHGVFLLVFGGVAIVRNAFLSDCF